MCVCHRSVEPVAEALAHRAGGQLEYMRMVRWMLGAPEHRGDPLAPSLAPGLDALYGACVARALESAASADIRDVRVRLLQARHRSAHRYPKS